MRLVCIVALFLIFGCSHRENPPVSTESRTDASPAEEIHVYTDVSSGDFQHPLVCGTGRDFPAGSEFALMNSDTDEPVHAVFPEGVAPPNPLDGKFILHGNYQGIQNKDIYKFKIPEEDYRYFVVSSWKNSN